MKPSFHAGISHASKPPVSYPTNTVVIDTASNNAWAQALLLAPGISSRLYGFRPLPLQHSIPMTPLRGFAEENPLGRCRP
jgi:hypothetical protein